MTPLDPREATDSSFANALLDSATDDAPDPQALERELARLGLGAAAGVAVIAAVSGAAAPTAGVGAGAAASKLTAVSLFTGASMVKIAVVAAIAVAGATGYVVLRPAPPPPAANAPAATNAPPAANANANANAPPAANANANAAVAVHDDDGMSKASPPVIASAAPSPSPSARATAAAGSKDARALAAEVALVDRARSLAHTSPDAALALLDEHARTFPGGALRDEAAVTRVEALLAAGRRADAERVARPFLQDRAGTPLARRLSDLLGTTNPPIP